MANNENQSGAAAAVSDAPQAVRFEAKKAYLKDVSFESPSTPGVFTQKWADPKIDVQAAISYRVIEENFGIFDVNLKVTVTARREENVLYLAEVQQAGVFQIQHPDADARQLVCEVTCPTILLPFAREELNSLITKGGFDPFLLAPINFEALYRTKKNQEKEQAGRADETGRPN